MYILPQLPVEGIGPTRNPPTKRENSTQRPVLPVLKTQPKR